MTLKKMSIAITATIVALAIGWVLAVRYLPPRVLYKAEIDRTEKTISQLEQYKSQHGSYPPESQFKLPKDDMFYTLKDQGYTIGFSTGFDEWFSYDSRNKKWSFDQ